MNYYQYMVLRLDGQEIRRRYSYYREMVRKGVAGFIVFGGDLETVRTYIRKLQAEAELPLIISADLERGLGQQLTGGTHFPPAMALAAAYKNRLKAKGKGQEESIGRDLDALRKSFRALAEEATYAGINTVFAPVLDINTNPKNPIIAARAFGENPDIVSLLGTEMIRTLQKNDIAACGKHFPGHGDTAVDSHIRLPVLKQDMSRLRRYELKPFKAAIKAGVKMIMLGHLSVPAIDPSGIPVSLSCGAVQYIRREMGFNGILITDALNMGGIGRFSEVEAARRSLLAGVDILLHPSDPDRLAVHLAKNQTPGDPDRLSRFRQGLMTAGKQRAPLFDRHGRLARQLTKDAISVTGRCLIGSAPLVVVLHDEHGEKGMTFIRSMEDRFPSARILRIGPGDRLPAVHKLPRESMIVAIFSETRAWKGGASGWLRRCISSLKQHADLVMSFGSPYLLDDLGNIPRLCAFWDSDQAQEAAVSALKRHCG